MFRARDVTGLAGVCRGWQGRGGVVQRSSSSRLIALMLGNEDTHKIIVARRFLPGELENVAVPRNDM